MGYATRPPNSARLDRPELFGQRNNAGSVPYPGPRFSGATWTAPGALLTFDSGSAIDIGTLYLFGGIGLRHVDAASFGGGLCKIESELSGWVTNLCDMWTFNSAKGWALVSVCSRDALELEAVELQPLGGIASLSPAASVLSATWLGRNGRLQLFGGVTTCGPWDGRMANGDTLEIYKRWAADAASVDNASAAVLDNMTRSASARTP